MKKISYFSGKVNGSSWTVFWTLLSMLSHKRNTRRFSGFRRKFSDVFGHLRAFANPWIVDCSQNHLIWETHLFYQSHLTGTFIKECSPVVLSTNSVGYIQAIEPHLSQVCAIIVTLMPSITRFILLTFSLIPLKFGLDSKISFAISWSDSSLVRSVRKQKHHYHLEVVESVMASLTSAAKLSHFHVKRL